MIFVLGFIQSIYAKPNTFTRSHAQNRTVKNINNNAQSNRFNIARNLSGYQQKAALSQYSKYFKRIQTNWLHIKCSIFHIHDASTQSIRKWNSSNLLAIHFVHNISCRALNKSGACVRFCSFCHHLAFNIAMEFLVWVSSPTLCGIHLMAQEFDTRMSIGPCVLKSFGLRTFPEWLEWLP